MIERGHLDDLAAFASVARHRSFRRAAAELGISTSNLSHIIRRLEQHLGVRLLQRNSRSVAPSESGAALLTTLAPSLDNIGSALDRLQRGQGRVSGTLRITATRHAYERVIRPVLPAFTAAHPDAAIEILIEYGFSDIIADQFDAGIRLGEKLAQDMIAVNVGPDLRMAVVAAPAYMAGRETPTVPQDLLHHRCINYRLTASSPTYAWEFEQAGKALQVRVPGPLAFNEPQLMLQGALDGLGIAYVLEHEAEPHIAAGRLVGMLGDWLAPFPGFFLYYPSRRQPRPVFSAFVDLLKQQARRPG